MNSSILKWTIICFLLLNSAVIWVFVSCSSSNSEFNIPSNLLKKKIYLYPGIGFEFVYLTDSIALKAEIQKQEEMLKSNWIFFSDPKKMIVRINQGSLDFAINSIEEITETNDMLFDIERIKPYVQEYSEYRKFRAEIKKNENNNSGIKTNTDNMSSWIEIYQVTTKSKSNLFIFNFITQERSKIFPERVDQKIYVFVEKNNYINDLKDYVKNN